MGWLLLMVAALSLGSVLAQAQTSKGYSCTVACPGHKAGYEWTEENGIADESACSGNSNSFHEGCQTWVEENDPSSSSSYDDQTEEETE